MPAEEAAFFLTSRRLGRPSTIEAHGFWGSMMDNTVDDMIYHDIMIYPYISYLIDDI